MLSPLVPFPVSQHSPQSALDDCGVGVYGQGTLTFSDKLDAIDRRARRLREQGREPEHVFHTRHRAADCRQREQGLRRCLAAVHVRLPRAPPKQMVYVTAARGFKAGGFNPASPAGSEAYGEEHSWNYEGGVKTLVARRPAVGQRSGLLPQLERPAGERPESVRPGAVLHRQRRRRDEQGRRDRTECPAVGGARPLRRRWLHATRASATAASRAASTSEGKSLPNTPDYTVNLGASVLAAGLSTRRRRTSAPRSSVYGDYQYDDANTAGQSAYSLVNLRGGVRGKRVFAEGWIRNAFDTRYVPTRSPTRASRRPASSARAARRARSGSAPE